MPTTVQTELDSYRAAFKAEGATSRRLLSAFPEARVDARPAPSAQPAREVAWTMVLTMMVVDPILAGELMPTGMPPAPDKWSDLLAAFDETHAATLAKLAKLDDAALSGPVKMPIGPGTIGEMRRGDALRMFLNDQIHHRGQLSVHLRMAGGKVPSIYGPSGDEAWF
ncbi:MAG: DinB family protein [Candidatus Eisenbacteria bacterium]